MPVPTDEGIELAQAVLAWKEKNQKTFPTFSELVEILKSIGRWKEKTS